MTMLNVTITVRRSCTVQVMQYSPETVDVSVTAEIPPGNADWVDKHVRQLNDQVRELVDAEQASLLLKSREAKR